MRTFLWVALGVYVLITCVFLVRENRRPQATLAWLLIFIFSPIVGFAVYLLFGRDRKAFSQQSKLQMQNLAPTARPLLEPIFSLQDQELSRLEQQSVVHRKLTMLVRRNSYSVLTTRNRVEVQQNADVFYRSLMAEIQAARHSVHLQYFIWRSDSFTEQLADLLCAKAQEGVEVRLLYDPIGSITTRGSYLRRMRVAGVQIAPTNPLYHVHTVSYRNHRKITVIDGVIGYTGGMNIGQEHIDGGKGFDFWRDTQIKVIGQAAAALQAVFLVDWDNAVRENLFAPQYFPAAAMDPPDGDVPVQILTSGPDSRWAAIRQLYFNMIVSATRHVYIQSPYFVLDATMAEALTSAALAGIDVKVMLSARESGNPVPNWAANTYIMDVVRAGVQVFLYEKGYLHAKTISVDSQICSIGTANIDIRSFSINYELNAVLYHPQTAQQLEAAFHADLEHCVEFRPAAYRRSNAALRFRDSVARLFSPLL